MNEQDSMKTLYEMQIAELKEQVTKLQEENRLLKANLDVAMGRNVTPESELGGPTPLDIIEQDARNEMGSENARAFK